MVRGLKKQRRGFPLRCLFLARSVAKSHISSMAFSPSISCELLTNRHFTNELKNRVKQLFNKPSNIQYMTENSLSNGYRFCRQALEYTSRSFAFIILNFVVVCIVTVQIIGAFGITFVNDTNTLIGQFLFYAFRK